MARGIRFKPNYAGYRDVLQSGAVQSLVESKAEAVASNASAMLDPDEGYRMSDFEVKPFVAKTGAHGRVVRTKTDHARYSQAKNKTLTKALKSV